MDLPMTSNLNQDWENFLESNAELLNVDLIGDFQDFGDFDHDQEPPIQTHHADATHVINNHPLIASDDFSASSMAQLDTISEGLVPFSDAIPFQEHFATFIAPNIPTSFAAEGQPAFTESWDLTPYQPLNHFKSLTSRTQLVPDSANYPENERTPDEFVISGFEDWGDNISWQQPVQSFPEIIHHPFASSVDGIGSAGGYTNGLELHSFLDMGINSIGTVGSELINYPLVDEVAHEIPKHAPAPVPSLDKFPLGKLPLSIRCKIWDCAVHVQNRRIDCPSLRRVVSAPVPVLFIVCKEAKARAEMFYVRIKGSDLLKLDYIPVTPSRRNLIAGPLLSFTHDIFVLDWHWREWKGATVSNPPIEERIRAINRVGIQRIGVTHERTGEKIFYRNARITAEIPRGARVNQLVYHGPEPWVWEWAHQIREVYLTASWGYYGNKHGFVEEEQRLFPPLPGSGCRCTLCVRNEKHEPIRAQGRLSYNYIPPAPNDIENHERMFLAFPRAKQ